MNKPKKLVLFDIDHTIFDTESYIEKLYIKLSLELGFSDREEFRKVADALYDNIRKRTKFLPPDFFLNQLLKSTRTPTTIKKLNKLFWNKEIFEASIYEDVHSTIKYLVSNNYIIGIFSTGDYDHQKIKVESLKEHLTDDHIYISEDKFKIIKKTLPTYENYKTYILDDLPEILHEAKIHNQKIFTILIKRQNNKREIFTPDNFKPDAVISNLDEFIDIIRANN